MRSLLFAILVLLVSQEAYAEVALGPRISVVNRGLGRPDVGVGLEGTATLQPASWLRVGLSGAAFGTGFLAGAPGFFTSAHGFVSAGSSSWEVGAGAGAAFMSVRLCGSTWCGRQTGVVPSGELRVKYVLTRDGVRSFGIVGSGAVHWVPASLVLPGLNGRADLGMEWAWGGG